MGLRGGIAAAAVLVAAGCYPPDRPCAVGSVCAVVGNGFSGYNGDGEDALETALYFPTAILRHPDGRLLFLDENNYRLRALESDGTVSTVAGNGVHAYSREGAPALETPFENPYDAAYGPDGALYVAGWHEGRILRIGEAGVVEVFAGTGEIAYEGDGRPATLASFLEPKSLAFGPDGSLFVTDTGANRVRRIAPDGIVDRVVGTGDAGPPTEGAGTAVALDQPEGLAWDPVRDRLLIGDTYSHRICAWDPSTFEVTNIAGTGAEGYSGDGGPAVQARLRFPRDLTVADDGTIFLTDTGNKVVREIAPDGTIRTAIGSRSGEPWPAGSLAPEDAPLDYPVGIFWDRGSLYFSDWTHQRVLVHVGATD